MTVMMKVTGKCNKCSKTLDVSGVNANRTTLFNEMKVRGWLWKTADEHLCPDHRPVAAKKDAKKSKSASKKVAKKAVSKKSSSKTKSKPVVLGGMTTSKPSPEPVAPVEE